jgi:hypothetical protein
MRTSKSSLVAQRLSLRHGTRTLPLSVGKAFTPQDVASNTKPRVHEVHGALLLVSEACDPKFTVVNMIQQAPTGGNVPA